MGPPQRLYAVRVVEGVATALGHGRLMFEGVPRVLMLVAPDRPAAYVRALAALRPRVQAVRVPDAPAPDWPLGFTAAERMAVHARGARFDPGLPDPGGRAAYMESIAEVEDRARA